MLSITLRNLVANWVAVFTLSTAGGAAFAAELLARHDDVRQRLDAVTGCQSLTLTSAQGVETRVPGLPKAELTLDARYMKCSLAERDVALNGCSDQVGRECQTNVSQAYPALLSQTTYDGPDLVIHPNTWHSKRHTCASGYAELTMPGFEARFVPTFGIARAQQVSPCELAESFASEELVRACALGEAWVEVSCDEYVEFRELVVTRERAFSERSASSTAFVANLN